MGRTQFDTLFKEIFQKNGLETYITDEIIEKFAVLTDIMFATNAVMNITAITTLEKIIPLHYADCVMAADYIDRDVSVLDVGCGGGFPILPLAIVRPDLKITGLDSTEKKVNYVKKTADALGLRVQTIHGRAEDIARDPAYREKYDIVISRAVARLNVLNELCLPLVKPGGAFWAMKGAAGIEEHTEAIQGNKKLGGETGRCTEYSLYLQDGAEKRSMICINKIHSTPAMYPRSFGAIKKKSL